MTKMLDLTLEQIERLQIEAEEEQERRNTGTPGISALLKYEAAVMTLANSIIFE